MVVFSNNSEYPATMERRIWRGWRWLKRFLGMEPERRVNEWETCSLHELLVRIMHLNKSSYVNIDSRDRLIRERDRLISIYSRRVKESNLTRK